jgi:hypothetical protein
MEDDKRLKGGGKKGQRKGRKKKRMRDEDATEIIFPQRLNMLMR